jgi:hypothetical protein
MDRRDFLKTTGLAAVGASAIRTLSGATQSVSIIVDPQDPIACAVAPPSTRVVIPILVEFRLRAVTLLRN